MQNAATWKKVIAFFINIIGSFLIFGYLIAWFTGGLKWGGFNLNGAPALLVFVLVIAYFIIFNTFLGGTLGKRLMGIAGR